MWYFLLPIYSVLDVLFMLFCLVFVNWWAPVFANEKGYLPNWLKWVGTFDDTLDAGTRDGVFPDTNTRYWNRCMWLYRNPSYNFGYYVLGCEFKPSEWEVKEYVPEGRNHRFYAVSKDGKFCLRFVWYGLLFKIGFKAWNLYNTDNGEWKDKPWGPEWRLPFCFSFSINH